MFSGAGVLLELRRLLSGKRMDPHMFCELVDFTGLEG
jgi:hypothetical protein